MPNSLKSLLPCPWCGGEAMAQKMILLDRWSISCTNIECIVDPIVIEPDHDTAITAWNTRAPIAEGGEGLCARLQGKCSDWGTYWRAPDAHGVQLSHAQAVELLVEALGVEVEIAAIESLSRQGWEPAYDRELIAKMLDESADVADCEIGFYSADTLREQAALLRAADSRVAAGVRTVSEVGKMDAIMLAYSTWPADIRKKLSLRDLRRMTGWSPPIASTPGDAPAVIIKGYPLWKAIHEASGKAGYPCNVGLAQVIDALDTFAQPAAPPVVDEAMVAVAYRVCEDFIEKHGDGYLNELDDGQWNEMLHAALTAALGKGEG